MKALIFLLLLKLSIFASPILDVQLSYEQLNKEIDTLSAKLSAEEKVALYFLVLSTHDKIATASMLGETQTDALKELREEASKTFEALGSNKKLTAQEVEKLQELYSRMHEKAEEIGQIKESEEPSSDTTSLFVILIVGSLSLGLMLGYIFFKKPHAKIVNNIDDALLSDLQEEYNNILDEVKSLERQKEFWHVEVHNSNEHLKNEKQTLEREIEELQSKTAELQNSHEVLISTFQDELKSLKT